MTERSEAVPGPQPASSGAREAGSSAGRGVVLVTGATGFLGSHIAEALVAEGWTVRCTVRATSKLRWIEHLPVVRLPVDLREDSGLAAALDGVDTVVHAAGLTRAGDAADFHRVNAEGTERLAGAAITAGVSRFVLVSSLAARGPDRERPAAGDQPVSPYGQSKLAGERRLFRVVAQAGGRMRPVILRPGGIYGPRDEDSLKVFRMARTGLLPAPTAPGRLQPVYVEDVAEATVRAAARPAVEMGPFDLVGPDILTWEQLADALGAAVGRRVRLVKIPAPVWQITGAVSEGISQLFGLTPQFDRRTAADLSSLDWTASLEGALSGLGWKPAIGARRALSLTADWYRGQGWLAS